MNIIKHVLLALLPSMLPTITLTSFIIYLIGGDLNHILFIGFLSGIVNPMTYLIAFLLGFIAYRFENIKQRVPIQIVMLSCLITALSFPIYIIGSSIQIVPLIIIFTFSLFFSSIISFLHQLIEKVYFNYTDKKLFSNELSLVLHKTITKMSSCKNSSEIQ